MLPNAGPGANAPDQSTAGFRPTRRHLLGALAAVPLLAATSACGGGDDSSSSDKVELSFMWWGAQTRADLTTKALANYTAKHPNVTFKTTWQANQGYYDKLATLLAGGNAPDIFQIDDQYLTDYASRGVTLDLTPYTQDKKLDVSKFPKSLYQYGLVDGKLAAMSFGENTQGLVWNQTLLDKYRLPAPKTGMSWDDFITWAANVSKTTKIPGTQDPSGTYQALWVWLRQNGADFYKGNQLGFDESHIATWFQLWADARAKGACPTPDVIHAGNDSSIDKQLVVTGKADTSWVWVNQMPDLKKNTKDTLGVMAYPGDPSAQWARASMYFAVYRASKRKDAAVDVINFLANDPDAGRILGTDRGLPSNLDIRTQVAQEVTDPNMKQTLTVQNELEGKFGPNSPAVPPKGNAKVRTELTRIAEEVIYGKATVQKGAAEFLTSAKAAIGQS
jgi:multiple sugar transport system substrate-binding protein